MFFPPLYLACLAGLTVLSSFDHSPRVTLLLLGSYLADMVARLP